LRGGTLLLRGGAETKKREQKARRANQSEKDFATIWHFRFALRFPPAIVDQIGALGGLSESYAASRACLKPARTSRRCPMPTVIGGNGKMPR
jgi:hypothetical protein